MSVFIYLCFVHQCMETLPSGVCWTRTTTLCVRSCGVRNSRLPSHLWEDHCVTGPGLLWKQSKKKDRDFCLISYFIEQRHVWVKCLHMWAALSIVFFHSPVKLTRPSSLFGMLVIVLCKGFGELLLLGSLSSTSKNNNSTNLLLLFFCFTFFGDANPQIIF